MSFPVFVAKTLMHYNGPRKLITTSHCKNASLIILGINIWFAMKSCILSLTVNAYPSHYNKLKGERGAVHALEPINDFAHQT